MWLGPVFHAELVGAARGRRFYALRVFYGLFVLYVVTSSYEIAVSLYSDQGGTIPIVALATIGTRIFVAFAVLQAIVFLVMTPALVAGAIADERQRKTLHYLMASTLTSPEIVGGKAAARLCRLGALGAVGLPILSLVGLFGGVDYFVVALVFGATASTTYFLAGLAVLCSVYAKRPRDAIAQAYFWEILWLTVPTILLTTIPYWDGFWKPIGEFFKPALRWVAATSPLSFFPRFVMARGGGWIVTDTLWLVGLQIVAGSAFLAVASWRLRPAFRAADGPTFWARLRGARARPRPRWRIWPRPACGPDAMLWKEMHTGGMSTGRRVALVLGTLLIAGVVGYATWDMWLGAADEAWRQNYWGYSRNQQDVNGLLRGANALLIVVILVGLGASAASSVTSELEGDTWISLAGSPLGGREVVLGKTLGSLWRYRWVAYALVACWGLGLLVGAVHPFGVLLAALELVVFAGFAAALGVAVSLRSRNSVRALTTTIGILLALNVGLPILLSLIRKDGGDELNLITCIPFLFTVALLGQGDFSHMTQDWAGRVVAASVLGVLPSLMAAVALTLASIRRYDVAADRPRRPDAWSPGFNAGPAPDAPRP